MNNRLAKKRNYRTCEVLRGVAIIGIFLHNYCHWLGPIVKENEYTYSQHHVDVRQQVLAAPDGQVPLRLVSFFGHYGVPLFLFLSAYGLVCKYERSGGPLPGTWRFVRYHFLKLFKMMVVGFVSFTVIDAITPGRWHYTVTQVVAQMAMVNNLLPDPDRQIWPGPYWFFGLMLQLYIVYRVALCRRSWRVTVIGMAVCVGIQLLLDCDGDAINRYRYNFMGGMLPFGLGLLYARYGERWRGRIGGSVWLWTVVSTVAVYVLSLHPVVLRSLSVWRVCVGSRPSHRSVGLAVLPPPCSGWETYRQPCLSVTPSYARSSSPLVVRAMSIPGCCFISLPRSAWLGCSGR